MPASNYTFFGKIYKPDGSTVDTSAKVTLYNHTQGWYLKSTTNSSGEYSIDLANGATAWADKDVIWIFVEDANQNAYCETYRTTVVLADGFEEKNLKTYPGHYPFNQTGKLHVLIVSNNNASAHYARLYDGDDRALDVHAPGTDTKTLTNTSPYLMRINTGLRILCDGTAGGSSTRYTSVRAVLL